MRQIQAGCQGRVYGGTAGEAWAGRSLVGRVRGRALKTASGSCVAAYIWQLPWEVMQPASGIAQSQAWRAKGMIQSTACPQDLSIIAPIWQMGKQRHSTWEGMAAGSSELEAKLKTVPGAWHLHCALCAAPLPCRPSPQTSVPLSTQTPRPGPSALPCLLQSASACCQSGLRTAGQPRFLALNQLLCSLSSLTTLQKDRRD